MSALNQRNVNHVAPEPEVPAAAPEPPPEQDDNIDTTEGADIAQDEEEEEPSIVIRRRMRRPMRRPRNISNLGTYFTLCFYKIADINMVLVCGHF